MKPRRLPSWIAAVPLLLPGLLLPLAGPIARAQDTPAGLPAARVAQSAGALAQPPGRVPPVQIAPHAARLLSAARVSPAQDHTQLTLESPTPLHWNLFSVEGPDRLVLDLDGLEPNAVTQALSAQVRADDPWIKAIRVGRFKPGTLRVVLDLKAAVKASATLASAGDHATSRLLLDLSAPKPVPDPLLVLLHEDGGGDPSPADAAAPTAASASGWVPEAQATASGSAAAGAGTPGVGSVQPGAGVAASAGPSAGSGSPASGNPASGNPVSGNAATSNATPAADNAVPDAPLGMPRKAPARAVAQNPAQAGPASSLQNPPATHATPAVAGNETHDGRRKLPADRLVTIAVDAGHGGVDPGAHGEEGTLEKDVTLAIALKLRDRIDAEPNLRAVLIRDGDYFVALGGRTAKARELGADLFVSVHADAFINRDARGSSVFALSERGATSVAARWLANRENQSDMIGGVNLGVRDPYLARTLFDLSQTATIEDSLRLARSVLHELSGLNALHRGEVEQAGFAVLKSPDIPSILVETAFITNPDEEHRLGDVRYQERIADTIVRGIRHYVQAHPPAPRSRLSANDPLR